MRASKQGANQSAGLNVRDVGLPGAGCDSDIITDAVMHAGSWFAILALGPAGSSASFTVRTSSIKTVNGVPQAIATAGAFKVNGIYRIISVGTTDFTQIGASTNAPGLVFQATGAGTGSGTAELTENDTIAHIQVPAGTTIYGEFQQITCDANTQLMCYRA